MNLFEIYPVTIYPEKSFTTLIRDIYVKPFNHKTLRKLYSFIHISYFELIKYDFAELSFIIYTKHFRNQIDR